MALDLTTIGNNLLVTAVGEITYNGVTFGAMTETTSFSARPVYDQAGRTVIYRLYSFTLKGNVFSSIPVTQTLTGTLTNGSSTVTGLSSTSTLDNQALVSGTGITDGTTISKIVSATELDLSLLATATGAQSLTFQNTTDEDMFSLRARLLQNGGELRYERKGVGRILVNEFGGYAGTIVDPSAEASYLDVLWGPKPQILQWRPRGSNGACEVVWSVEFAIADCPTTELGNRTDRWLEYNFRLNFNVDRSGYSRRSTTGFLRVAGWRRPEEEVTATGTGVGEVSISRKLPNTADYYRERITPSKLPGFRRETQDFTLDESKCRLDFSIVDQEMPPDIPPEGVIDATASFSVRQLIGLTKWEATLSATYEMARGKPKELAWKHFRDLIADRQNAKGQKLSVGTKNEAVEVWFHPIAFSMSEPNLYGRAVTSFSLTYIFITSFANLMKVSGMWRPVPGSNWNKWASSLDDNLGSRGNQRLRFTPDQEVIIDICAQPVTTEEKASGGVKKPSRPSSVTIPPFPGMGLGLPGLNFPKPPEKASWALWENNLDTESHEQLAQLKPLPETDKELHQVEAILQERASPTNVVIMHGFAARVGWPVDVPVLQFIGGIACEPADLPGFGVRKWVASHWGQPLHCARWRRRYVLKKTPLKPIKGPINPQFGADDKTPATAPAFSAVGPRKTFPGTSIPIENLTGD